MQEVRMVKAVFQGGWDEDVCDELKIFVKPSEDYGRQSFWSRPRKFYEYSEEQWKEFIETEEFKSLVYYGHQNLLMQYEDFIEVKFAMSDETKLRSESTFKIKVSNTTINNFDLIETHIALMNKQFEQLSKYSTQTFNEKVGVPNYDSTMLKMNQMMLLEDCCTDYLQEALRRGWRIISVSPQPDQRRPDYVLGKAVKNPKGMAIRGWEDFEEDEND